MSNEAPALVSPPAQDESQAAGVVEAGWGNSDLGARWFPDHDELTVEKARAELNAERKAAEKARIQAEQAAKRAAAAERAAAKAEGRYEATLAQSKCSSPNVM